MLYVCTKDVIMEESETRAYTAGKFYDIKRILDPRHSHTEYVWVATDDQGDRYHLVGDPDDPRGFCAEYFKKFIVSACIVGEGSEI